MAEERERESIGKRKNLETCLLSCLDAASLIVTLHKRQQQLERESGSGAGVMSREKERNMIRVIGKRSGSSFLQKLLLLFYPAPERRFRFCLSLSHFMKLLFPAIALSLWYSCLV